MLKTVTITGADNSIRPGALKKLSQQFPFVEWGILISRKSMGSNRFPDMEWLQELAAIKQEMPELKLSCHLCGAYVREILMGDASFIYNEIGESIFDMFERVQINTHGDRHDFYSERMIPLLKNCNKEIIFQFDDANEEILEAARAGDVNCSALFDMSHGAGVLPGVWPLPIDGLKCGYAGGLGPKNLLDQLALIEAKAGEAAIWIDVETKVRSEDDQYFDLHLVKWFLSLSEQFMKSREDSIKEGLIPQRGVVVLTETEQDFATYVGYEVKLKDGGTGVNMGLYFPETWAEDGILKANGVNVFFPEQNKIYVQNFNQVELIFPNGKSRMNQSEALFGFTSWLTTRSQPVTFSGKHNAAVAVELVNMFMKINNLPRVRENWTDYLVGMGAHDEIAQEVVFEEILPVLPVSTMMHPLPVELPSMQEENGIDEIPNTKHSSYCLHKAKDDEPIFVLLGRDDTADVAIVNWVTQNLSGQPFSKLYGALKVVEQMQSWRERQKGGK